MQDSSSTFYKIQETPGVGLGLGLMLVPGGQVSCVCLCVSVCVQGWVLHVRYACIDMHVRMHARMHVGVFIPRSWSGASQSDVQSLDLEP
jgi:hypothetical protein